MRKYWLQLELRIDALSQRERWTVFLMLASAICAIAYFLVLAPLLSQSAAYRLQIAQNGTRLSSLQQQERELTQALQRNPDSSDLQQIALLEQLNQVKRVELARAAERLASQERIPQLLQDLLAGHNIRLLSLRTLPIDQPQADAATTESSTPPASTGPAVFRHPIQVTLQGSYPALADYVRRVEQLPWKIYWGDIDLRVEQYPDTTVTLTIYTLSLDKAWLSL